MALVMSTAIHVQLDAFEGPFDLLFHLIEKNEIDIYDIPIAKLTKQYLEIIKNIPPDMDSMSEFLVMAATLLEIKSKMLLPRHKPDDDEEEDPRESLVRQLIAYKHCQELSGILQDIENTGKRVFKNPEHPLMTEKIPQTFDAWLDGVTPESLMQTFLDILQRQALKVDVIRQNFGTVPRETYTVEEKIRKISNLLSSSRPVLLSNLFEECSSREECIVTFLAVLELIKMSRATVSQTATFGEIEVSCPT